MQNNVESGALHNICKHFNLPMDAEVPIPDDDNIEDVEQLSSGTDGTRVRDEIARSIIQ